MRRGTKPLNVLGIDDKITWIPKTISQKYLKSSLHCKKNSVLAEFIA